MSEAEENQGLSLDLQRSPAPDKDSSEELLISMIPAPREIQGLSLDRPHSQLRHKPPNKEDSMIIRDIGLLDNLDKEFYTCVKRLQTEYGKHFPELVEIVQDSVQYAKTVKLMGRHVNAAEINFSEVLSEEIEAKVKEASIILVGAGQTTLSARRKRKGKTSVVLVGARQTMLGILKKRRKKTTIKLVGASQATLGIQKKRRKKAAIVFTGTQLSDIDFKDIKANCDRVLALADNRFQLRNDLSSRMRSVAPSLTDLVGEFVGARLIARHGGLLNLAKQPPSSLNILAYLRQSNFEVSAFKKEACSSSGIHSELSGDLAVLKESLTKHGRQKHGSLTKHGRQKHGLGQVPNRFKTKISRSIAAKCTIAARCDAFSDTGTARSVVQEILAKLDPRMSEIAKELGATIRTAKATGYASLKWKPPRAGVIKINVDASVCSKVTAVGAVFRDSFGRVVFCFSKVTAAGSPEQGETQAILEGLLEAKNRGMQDIVVESDCMTAVRFVSGKCPPPWTVRQTSGDCRAALEGFQSVSVIHTPRESNSVAHTLAKRTAKSGCDFSSETIPRCISKLVRRDKPNVTTSTDQQ